MTPYERMFHLYGFVVEEVVTGPDGTSRRVLSLGDIRRVLDVDVELRASFGRSAGLAGYQRDILGRDIR